MTTPPNVLALVGHAFGAAGGVAQYNRDFLSALAASGAAGEIEILPREAGAGAATPAGIVQHAPIRGRAAYAAGAIARVLRRPADIVFCGHLYMAPLAAAVARLARAKLIVQTHGVEAWRRPSAAQRAAVERADLVLCVSRRTRAEVLGWAAIEPERLVVLPDTVGEAFTPGDGAALRRAWGLDGRVVLLTVGRMDGRERYKGHDRVIAAMPELLRRGLDAVYVVIGEGDDRPRLEALAAQAGVSDRVRFMGAADQETLIEACRMADLFVMPSLGEGFGIAYLEAMACGCRAVGFDAGGARDALGDGELGVIATPATLAEDLAAALSRPGPAAQDLSARVQAKFGKAVFAAELGRIFDRLSRGDLAGEAALDAPSAHPYAPTRMRSIN
jgi:phosphatidylinositol alpha-1,6-mannosyltransferase